jgi:hypothetical protein
LKNGELFCHQGFLYNEYNPQKGGLMIKASALSIIIFSFIFLVACANGTPPATATVNPSAQPLMETIAVYAKTVEGIVGSATSYSFTPTLTYTPTVTPNAPEINKTISNSINNQLISNFGARITVGDVKFGPIGAQEYTSLYIEIKCIGDNNSACPTTNVIIAVMDACKEKKKKVLENIPSTTQVLTITIFDPVTRPKVVEVNWSDVLAYINGDVPGQDFSKQIRYVQ